MRLLDTYALACGAKIDRPFIYETMFPLSCEKYITFQAQSQARFEAKNYTFWQDVINIIFPTLQAHGIHIVQIGQGHEKPYQRVIDLRGQTNIHQLAYIIKRSLTHVGPDSFGIHLASSFDVPIVGLYSVAMPEIGGPCFGNKDKQILFRTYERIDNKKPAYSFNEFPKSIDTIKPEEIAAAIFRLLNIAVKIPIETIHLGAKYSNAIMRELMLDTQIPIPSPEAPVEIKFDMNPDEKLLSFHLSYLQKAAIVTDRPINISLLKAFKPHIFVLIYKITEQDNPEFLKQVINLGINTVLVCEENEEFISRKKIIYYEYGKINQIPHTPEDKIIQLRQDIDKLFYKTGKLVLSNGKFFASRAAHRANLPLQNDTEYQKVIDTQEFWDEIDFFTIVKKLD